MNPHPFFSKDELGWHKADYLATIRVLSPSARLILFVWGVMLLITDKIGEMANKLTPTQRVLLMAATLSAGAALLTLLVRARAWELALFVMFLLGFLLGEIARW
jgi:hypothetical protein